MKNKGILATLLAFLIALAGSVVPPASAQSDVPAGATKPTSDGSHYVIYQDASGETTCRAAAPGEMPSLLDRGPRGRVIYSGAPQSLPGAPGPLDMVTSETGTQAGLLPSAGLHIVLRGTDQLEQNPTAKQAFIVAANRWEAIISTPITVVIDVDYGTTFFTKPYNDPDILGATGAADVVTTLADVRQRLLSNSPTAAESQLYQTLPTNAVKTELGDSTFNSATVRLTAPNARALGIISDVTDPNAAPPEVRIGFNSAFSFDFNPDDGIEAGKTDFDAVATHEIGHALGFASESGGNVYASASMLDLFRFRPGAASLGTFPTASRVMSAGGAQVFFDNQTNTFGTQELQLSTGGPSGKAAGGDGRQSSHWKDDRLGVPYVGIMDPTLARGVREVITNNDVRAFDSMGYSFGAPVPAPPGPTLFPAPSNNAFANAAVITGASGVTSGYNFGATREAGEPVHPDTPGGRSVWYRWTAPSSGQVTIETQGSGFDTILAVYTGSGLTGLTRQAANDDIQSGVITSSRVTFTATAGTVYQIQIDGFDNGQGAEFGIIQLNWSMGAANPTNPGVLQFSSAGLSVGEPAGIATFTVTRTGGTDGAVSVNFFTQSGTATPGADYTSTVGTLSFAAGEAQKTFNVVIMNDSVFENPETVNLSLSSPTGGATLGAQSTATLTILSDDFPPTFSIGNVTHAEGNSGTTPFFFTVTKIGQTELDSSVTFTTAEDTATAVLDYTPASGTLNFAPTEATKTITVLVNGDAAFEATESFLVKLLSATNAGILNGQAFGSIINDDSAPPQGTVQFSSAAQSIGEGAGSVTVNVTRSDASAAGSVEYATGGGTADSAKDYTLLLGRLDFAAGEATKPLTVLLTDDVFDDENETFNITLSNAVGMTLGTPSSATITIADNDGATGLSPVRSEAFDAQFFVRQHYLDFFSREPDAPGLAHWTNIVNNCGDPDLLVCRINVSGAFFLSIEFKDTGYLIARAYKAAYGDATGNSTLGGTPHTLTVPVIRFEEFLPDTQRIGRGVVVLAPGWEAQLEANKQAYFLEFVQRSRFTTDFPLTMTPTAFVDQSNARAGFPLDAAERQSLINELTANNTTAGRASVLRKVAEDPTLASAEINRAFVLMQYFGYLRRNPNGGQDTDHTGYEFWLGNLERFGGNFVHAELVKAFILSDEYQKRFGN